MASQSACAEVRSTGLQGRALLFNFFLGLSLLIGWSPTLLTAQEPEAIQLYAEGLRARNLLSLAEEGLSRLLRSSRLTPEQAAAATRELSFTLSEHGALETGSSRDELWERSRQTLREFLQTLPDSSSRSELEASLRMLMAGQAMTLAEESDLSPENQQQRDQALERLREAIPAVQAAVQRLNSDSRTKESSGMAAKELITLVNCRHWLARLLPSGRERTSVLLDAAQSLGSVSRGVVTKPDGPLLIQLNARQARLQGDDRQAEQILTAALEAGREKQISPVDQDRLFAERLRVEIDRQRLDQLFDLLKVRLQSPPLPSDELRAVIVQSLILAAEKALALMESQRADESLAEARAQAEKLSGRWRRDALLRLERFQHDRQYGAELATRVRMAMSAWQTEQGVDAGRLYQEASRFALQTHKEDLAVELGMTAASIFLQLEKWNEAAAGLQDLEQAVPDHARIPDVDLLRCYALGRREPVGQEFQSALKSHLARFPQSATRGDALRMLGVTAEFQQQPLDALDWYRQIPDAHAVREEADVRSLAILLKQTALPTADRQLDERGREQIQRTVQRLQPASASWNPEQCRLLLQSAQLLMTPRLQGAEPADRLLTAVQQRIETVRHAAAELQEPLSAEWSAVQQLAIQLKIVSLAGQKRLDEARQVLKNFETQDATQLLAILVGLKELSAPFDAQQRYDLGHLQLQAIQRIRQHQSALSADQMNRLKRATAEAYLAVNDWSRSITAYQELLRDDPTNSSLVDALIQASVQQGLPEDLQRATQLWNNRERAALPGSIPWMEARLEQVRLLIRQKKMPDARKLLGVARTLYPQMGTPALKHQSDELWKQLESP